LTKQLELRHHQLLAVLAIMHSMHTSCVNCWCG